MLLQAVKPKDVRIIPVTAVSHVAADEAPLPAYITAVRRTVHYGHAPARPFSSSRVLEGIFRPHPMALKIGENSENMKTMPWAMLGYYSK